MGGIYFAGVPAGNHPLALSISPAGSNGPNNQNNINLQKTIDKIWLGLPPSLMLISYTKFVRFLINDYANIT